MRRVSTTPTLAIAICILLGALVPAAPAAAAPHGADEVLKGIWEEIRDGFVRSLGWLPRQAGNEVNTTSASACIDPNGNAVPPGPTCPAPPPAALVAGPKDDQGQ